MVAVFSTLELKAKVKKFLYKVTIDGVPYIATNVFQKRNNVQVWRGKYPDLQVLGEVPLFDKFNPPRAYKEKHPLIKE